MSVSTAQVKTAHAGSYLRKLCQHWSHRFPVEYSPERGTIQLPQATCMLAASPEGLTVRLDLTEGADESHLHRIVEEHIRRFAVHEELTFVWNLVLA